MTDIFSYSLSCIWLKQHNAITFLWYQERRNSLYNTNIKKNWRTYKGHWWILKKRRCSLSVHQKALETHSFEGGTLSTLLGTMKFRALTHPDLKIPCKSSRRLYLSFCFDLQEETDKVMNQELQGLPQLSNVEWLCDLIFLADVFSSLSRDRSKVPENSHLLCLTVWIHLKEHWNDCKSPIQAWTKKMLNSLSVPLWTECGSHYLKILLAN